LQQADELAALDPEIRAYVSVRKDPSDPAKNKYVCNACQVTHKQCQICADFNFVLQSSHKTLLSLVEHIISVHLPNKKPALTALKSVSEGVKDTLLDGNVRWLAMVSAVLEWLPIKSKRDIAANCAISRVGRRLMNIKLMAGRFISMPRMRMVNFPSFI